MLTLLVGAIAAYALFLILGTLLAPKVALRRHHARLRAMDASAMALEARRCADAAGMRAHFPGARLFSGGESWTRESLALALDELYANLNAQDRKNGELGPGSWIYSWYDSSLAFIRQTILRN